jgi:hypothetical protein
MRIAADCRPVRRQEALRHARIYLKFDPRSEWAAELREKLGIA